MISTSIVVPIYNSAKYLPDCLDSILSQSNKNFEIICLDDYSKDNSHEIMREYAKCDNRIKNFFSEENHGAAYTRNLGLLKSKGKFVWFVDADDIVKPNALTTLSNIMQQDNLDLICFDAEVIFEDDSVTQHGAIQKRKKNYPGILSGIDFFVETIENDDYTCLVGCQFWRREFLLSHNIKFPTGIMHEDVLFSFEAILNVDKLKCLSQEFYIYRRHNDSVVTSKMTSARLNGIATCALRTLAYADKCSSIFSSKRCREILNKYFYYQMKDLQNALHNYLLNGKNVTDLSGKNLAGDCFLTFLLERTYQYINPMLPTDVIKRMKDKQIIVYGAGAVGSETINLLDAMGFKGYFIAVSKVNNKNQNLKISSIYDLVFFKDNSIVLLAVTDKYQPDMIRTLEKLGFEDYYCMI